MQKTESKITNTELKKSKSKYLELSSLTKQAKKNIEPFKQTQSLLETPFHMLLVGMTACGKTWYLLQLLEKEYMKHFNRIYLLCPTFDYNTTYQNWQFLHDEGFIVVPCTQDNVNDKLERIVELSRRTNSLIILDDCASGNAVKNRTSELVKLGFSGRHYGISSIVLTQQLTSIAKPYREQASKIVCFLPSSDRDLKYIFEEYLSDATKEELSDIKRKLKTIKYARLEIMRRVPQNYRVVTPSETK